MPCMDCNINNGICVVQVDCSTGGHEKVRAFISQQGGIVKKMLAKPKLDTRKKFMGSEGVHRDIDHINH